MIQDLADMRRLTEKLRTDLAQCAQNPGVDAVHDTRTGTRRLQATLENLVRAISDDAGPEAKDAAKSMMRLLKKIRHAAGTVRDLDVHRKLLKKLAKKTLKPGTQDEDQGRQKEAHTPSPLADEPDVLETPEVGMRRTGVEGQADDLDGWLKERRGEAAAELQMKAASMVRKLDKRLARVEEAMRAGRSRRSRKKAPAIAALDNFARLATEMQLLDAGNLHDFRKGAKKARYVAELAAQGDTQAEKIGSTLKKLQDEIGDWHDWLVLAEETHTALGSDALELTALLEKEREKHFVIAMKTASKLRGRLMGEWQALARGQNGQRAPRAKPIRGLREHVRA